VETTFAFRHVYLSGEKRGKELQKDAVRILAELQRDANPDQFGDSSLIEPEFAHVTKADVERIFGEPFAANIAAIQPDQWQGPIESGYGLHLVQISERQEGRLASLGEVREQVRRDWENEKRQESIEKFYTALIQRYMVRIEPPQETKIAEAR
jgi:parvulin-like peptidyl-prolyl isomerase